ncbi:hypothetical protein GQ42DRAFT_123144 [Ramicandelaber brevisporus]|nr:hypothetical protein GQ42DRAFT_123144 [Ramicandelaber brevisporus]
MRVGIALNQRQYRVARLGGHRVLDASTPISSLKRANLISTRSYASNSGHLPYDDDGETGTGSVRHGEQTGSVYLDNIFPLKYGQYDFRDLLMTPWQDHFVRHAEERLLPHNIPHGFRVVSLIPRAKDGGVLVKFVQHKQQDESHTKVSAPSDDILARIRHHLDETRAFTWFNLQRVRAFQVRGTPFLEDIGRITPSRRLKITMNGPALHVEDLYEEMRQFGRIVDIEVKPGNAKESTVPYAIVQFMRLRSAASARNCMHGESVLSTRLDVTYEKMDRTNPLVKWISEHPRFTVPLALGATIAGVYALFAPVRTWFIINRTTHRYDFTDSEFVNWIRRMRGKIYRTAGYSSGSGGGSSGSSSSHDGGAGASGLETRAELVDHVTAKKRNKVIIDCDDLANASNAVEMLEELASQIGYRPLLSSIIFLTNLANMFVAVTTGQKSELAATAEGQIQEVLETTAAALESIRNSKLSAAARTGASVSVDINVGDEQSDDPKLAQIRPRAISPEDIPVVVISGFMRRDTSSTVPSIWDVLADWGAFLTENQLAHVVFVTSNVAAMKTLTRAMPHHPLHHIAISDASHASALNMLLRRLGPEYADAGNPAKVAEVEEVVRCLGGRFTDLEDFSQKMHSGHGLSPKDALEELVEKVLSETRKTAFSGLQDSSYSGRSGFASSSTSLALWTPEQMWSVIASLVDGEGSVSYDRIRASPLFNGDDMPLQAMEYAELITISSHHGRPATIKPGRPVLSAVYRKMVDDAPFAAWMHLVTNKALIKILEGKITKWESELKDLQWMSPSATLSLTDRSQLYKAAAASTQSDNGSWARWLWPPNWFDSDVDRQNAAKRLPEHRPAVPRELASRVNFLLDKIERSHAKIAQMDEKVSKYQTYLNNL